MFIATNCSDAVAALLPGMASWKSLNSSLKNSSIRRAVRPSSVSNALDPGMAAAYALSYAGMTTLRADTLASDWIWDHLESCRSSFRSPPGARIMVAGTCDARPTLNPAWIEMLPKRNHAIANNRRDLHVSAVRTVDKISVASEPLPVTRGWWTSQAQTRRCNAGAHTAVSLGNVW